MKYFNTRDFLWIAPLSLALGAGLSSIQTGNWLIGWLGFSCLFLLSFFLLTLSVRWASGASTLRQAQGSASFNSMNTSFTPLTSSRRSFGGANKTLAWMAALAFGLRLAGGVATYGLLPINGYDEPDDRAGFVFTDAHRRDNQAWELASSGKPILDAVTKKYSYDQYGGLLAFSALIYRYLSPDAHRPLMMVLMSALIAALGIPFLWKAVSLIWGEKVALTSGWIFALYPESILLGGAAMREPYLMTFSAISLWGFASWQFRTERSRSAWYWLGLGIMGMLFVSPVVALVTLIIFAGWMYFTSERGRVSWWAAAITAAVFVAGLFILSAALNRQGNLGSGTPVGIIGAFMREAVKMDVYQLERGSGWVQKLFDVMPAWLRLPFVMVYGIFQPVLPAAFVEPTTLTWRVIGILRAVGWYALLPLLILPLAAAAGDKSGKMRKLWMWITVITWTWILLTALRGGGDQWDNPRYRAILFLWQAMLAGYTLVWWRETKTPWPGRIIGMEVVFLLFFSLWYGYRYYHVGLSLPFGTMVAIILGLWVVILLGGWLWDRVSA